MAEDNPPHRARIPKAAAGALILPGGLRALRPPWGALPALEWRGWVAHGLEQEVEHRRLFPWLAVSFGLGVILFFQADGRPALWAPLLGFGLCLMGAWRLRHGLVPFALLIGAAALFAGFAAAILRTAHVEAPVLARTYLGPLSGFIVAVEDRPEGARLLIELTNLGSLPETERPRKVRVSVKETHGLGPGLFIAAQARLLPPPQPAWPGGYDFARDAYFRGIGAVGSLQGSITVMAPPHAPPFELRIGAAVDEARNELTQRIANAIGGAAGAVAAALVTGKRGLIDETTNDVLRGAGIYHIVSISGLHMVLAAGTVFWLVRALLALSATAALMWPVKKIAALAAILGAMAYCIFSGAEVATQRALIMTVVMFGAVLVDRPALSIRNLAVAALIVLAFEPEAVMGPSFQMSFGAVAALIAVAPLLQIGRLEGRGRFAHARLWAMRAGAGLLGTTFVATLATGPFSAYHFQTLNPLGLIGNALALPLVSLAVMPAALLGILAYPFGLDRPIWQVMGWAVGHVLRVSEWVSALDGASVVVPALSSGALLLLSLALLMLTLMRSHLRWVATLPAGLGLALAGAPERADIFVDREGGGAAVRGLDGRLAILGRPSDFVVEQWLRADGDARATGDESLKTGVQCDRLGCTMQMADSRAVSFVRDAAAFEEDCRRAAVILTGLQAPPRCAAPLILDRSLLQARGATTVRFVNGMPQVHGTRNGGDPRPWTGAMPAKAQGSGQPRSEARPAPRPEPEGSALNTVEPD